jgi:4-amino-4-deoxy-L-arabinose transferase-like glycosyltransferase
LKHTQSFFARDRHKDIIRAVLLFMSKIFKAEHSQHVGSKGKRLCADARHWPGWAALCLTLATFGLRLYHLGNLSLRGDEAFDVLFASQPLSELLHQFRFVQPYPPLFHMGLHFWLPVAGQSEVAVRFGAVLASTLVVPATYVLGTQLFNQRIGLMGALLAMINPFIHWWGQDAHFYAYLVAMATLLNVVTLRFWRSTERMGASSHQQGATGWLPGALFVLTALVSFLTHYFAYFAWGALNVVAVIQSVRRRWSVRLIRRWWSAQAVLIVLYLPWLILTWPVNSSYVEPWIEQTTPWSMLWRDLVAFSLGYASPLPTEGLNGQLASASIIAVLVGFLGALFGLGMALGWKQKRRRPGLSLALALIFVPLTAMYLASFHRPIFDEKLTIFIVPLFLLVVSLGVVSLAEQWRWVGGLAGLAVVIIMSFAGYQYFGNLQFAKSPAWHEMFDYIHQKAQAGDLLVYNFPDSAVLHYNDGKLPIELIPNSAKLEADEINAQLQRAVAPYGRVWLVPLVRPWWDTRGEVVTWLDRHGDRLDQRFFRGVHTSLYLTPDSWRSKMIQQPATFAEGLRLQGFRMGRGEDQAGEASLSPGDTLYLSLYWRAEGPTHQPLTVFTHLLGPDGQLYGQWDNPPVRGTYPTTDWLPGEEVVDQYEIPVNPAAPPGEYRVLVGLYDPGTGTRVAVLTSGGHTTEDSVTLSRAVVVKER